MSEYVLEMRNITKEFPGVKALDDVTLKVKKGEIHALVGENGAGKSTLMKILSGFYASGTYHGKLVIKDSEIELKNIKDSEKYGIGIIYQELALVKLMNVCENIFLGNEIHKNGRINMDESFFRTKKILSNVHLDINPATKVIHLGIGQQQLVEIAKVLSKNVEILILDEPTAALTEAETDNLLGIIRELKGKGVSCIYISHKINEVFQIADTITVLRDGKTVCTKSASEYTENSLISYMVGRELTNRFPPKDNVPGEVIFEVKDWTVHNPEMPDKVVIDSVSFQAKKGEILGIAGLMGSGRTELAMSIFRAYGAKISGEIRLHGKALKIGKPCDAIDNGICYLTEDRKGNGLVLMMDVKENICMASLKKLSKMNVINDNQAIVESERTVKSLNIKTPSLEQKLMNLSGGNQQKVSLGKWLLTNPVVLILDEPTRGIDVGAKYEIYKIINDLARAGGCIIMISSEMPEILGVSDRILVMNKGRITGELAREEATQEKILSYATGGGTYGQGN
jgi:ABC-type sugar transport system ATPase subunit